MLDYGVQPEGAVKNAFHMGGQVLVEKTLSQADRRRSANGRGNDIDLLVTRGNDVYVALGLRVSVIRTSGKITSPMKMTD